jgi:hypothetical protein
MTTDDEPKVINLDQHRLRLAGEGKPGAPDLDTDPVAYIEGIWGTDAYGWNAVIVDIEAMRRGGEHLPLRPPETSYEVGLIIRHMRALANDIARQSGMGHLVREEDEL